MNSEDNKKEILLSDVIHYYEVRMSALSEYSDRVWNRFNWLLTLQLAISGFYFSQLDKLASFSVFKSGVPIIGFVVAILWLIMGAEDFVSMRKYGKRTTEVENKVKTLFSRQGVDFNSQARKSFVNFRQTWLLFIFPALIIFSWAVVYVLFLYKA